MTMTVSVYRVRGSARAHSVHCTGTMKGVAVALDGILTTTGIAVADGYGNWIDFRD